MTRKVVGTVVCVDYMQKAWNFIWPGILAAFLVGMVIKRAPAGAAVLGLLISVPAYGFFFWLLEDAFLNAAALSFLVTCAAMGLYTWARPLPAPRDFPDAGVVDLEPSRGAPWAGAGVIALTVMLYIVFW